jgi:hypothetical protein
MLLVLYCSPWNFLGAHTARAPSGSRRMTMGDEPRSALDGVIVGWSAGRRVPAGCAFWCAAVNSLGDGVLAVFPPEHFSTDAYRTIPDRWWRIDRHQRGGERRRRGDRVVLGTLRRGARSRRVRGADPRRCRGGVAQPGAGPCVGVGVSFMLFYVWLRNATGGTRLDKRRGPRLAHAAYTVPFVFAVVGARLASFDVTLEDAAMGLGASRTRPFCVSRLPILMPAILMGGLFAFLISVRQPAVVAVHGECAHPVVPVELFNASTFEGDAGDLRRARRSWRSRRAHRADTFRYLRSVLSMPMAERAAAVRGAAPHARHAPRRLTVTAVDDCR